MQPACRWQVANLPHTLALVLALPGMLANDWGRIINVASVHGLVGSAQKSAYVAAKHGTESCERRGHLVQ